jgi:multidrug efflux system membrane fusion protein
MTKLQSPVSQAKRLELAERKMEEQVKPQTTRRWPWMVLFLVVLVVTSAVGWRVYTNTLGSNGAASRAVTTRPSPVVVSVARKGDMNLYLTGLGNVVPFNTVTVRSRVDGNLDKINFTEGQLVHEGDLLCEIDPRPFKVQLETAEAQLARDQAALNNALLNVKRDTEAKDAISAQQLSTDQATADQAAASMKIDQAAVDSAQLQMTYSRITAPITGRVGLRIMDRGNMVHASDANGIAVITQLQPISVVFTLPEDNLQRVRKRMADGALPVEAYDRDLITKLSAGTLGAIDNQIDANSGTFKLKATFANDDSALFPNQFVNARLLVETRREATIIPMAAVQQSPDSTFVYVVKDDPVPALKRPATRAQGSTESPPLMGGIVEIQKVELGPNEGDSVVITAGITPGDIVVTDGVDKLLPNSKVTYSVR